MAMIVKQAGKTFKELVREKHPTAFVDDDGDWIYIRIKRTTICSECNGTGKCTFTDFTANALGAGGDESATWENAARKLGLIHP